MESTMQRHSPPLQLSPAPHFPQPAECFISKSILCYQPLLTPQPQVLETFIAFPSSCSSPPPYPQVLHSSKYPTLCSLSCWLNKTHCTLWLVQETHRQPGDPLHVLNGQMATNCHLPVALIVAGYGWLSLPCSNRRRLPHTSCNQCTDCCIKFKWNLPTGFWSQAWS